MIVAEDSLDLETYSYTFQINCFSSGADYIATRFTIRKKKRKEKAKLLFSRNSSIKPP
jgi:hypothetical protein